MVYAYIIGSLEAGGSERQLYYLCRSLVEIERKKVLVINWSGNQEDFFMNDFVELGVEVVLFNDRIKIIDRIVYLRKLIKEKKIDILHSFSFYLNFIAFLLCFGTKCVSFGSIRSSYNLLVDDSTHTLLRYLNLLFPKKIIVNSVRATHELRKKFWIIKHKFFYLNNHFEPFSVVKKTEKLDNMRFDSELITISIGRCDSNKRIDLIIDVIYQLHKRNIPIRHYHLGDGILKNDLRSIVEVLCLSEVFMFTGKVKQVEAYLANADILIHASDSEGAPNSIIEAMSLGVVPVSTDCGDSSFIIKNGVNGVIIPGKNDVISFVNAIQGFINNQQKLDFMADQAQKTIKENFLAKDYGKKMIFVYEQKKNKVLN